MAKYNQDPGTGITLQLKEDSSNMSFSFPLFANTFGTVAGPTN